MVRLREHTGVLCVQHIMNTNLRLVLIGGAGFCVGFTVCALLFVPTAKQQQASSIPSIQVVAAPLAGRLPPNAKPQLPEWQPHLMLPTLPPKFPGYQN